MFKGHRIVCVIPARSGSKGLPGKNIKMLLGKPLIAHTIGQARRSGFIDRVIVSTDSALIAKISKRYGAEVPFIRPKRLASDRASTIDVLLHAVDWIETVDRYEFDLLVLLHASAPLRSVNDIDNCIKLLGERKVSNVFSVCEARRNPYFNMVEVVNGTTVRLVKKRNFTARQEAPSVFDVNASIYVWRKDALKKEKAVIIKGSRVYVMPMERSVDIDDELDFKIAEMLMKKRR